jgi:hypothetical protein
MRIIDLQIKKAKASGEVDDDQLAMLEMQKQGISEQGKMQQMQAYTTNNLAKQAAYTQAHNPIISANAMSYDPNAAAMMH